MTDQHRLLHNRRAWALGASLLLVFALLAVVGLSVGSTGLESVWAMWQEPVAQQIVIDIRAPRTLGCFFGGCVAGLGGCRGAGFVS